MRNKKGLNRWGRYLKRPFQQDSRPGNLFYCHTSGSVSSGGIFTVQFRQSPNHYSSEGLTAREAIRQRV
jgi:hypothetical protein